MLHSLKRRYLSVKSYNDICRLIDKFFDKDALKYTDVTKLVKSIDRLQASINSGNKSPVSNLMINKLFGKMKDKAISTFSEK